MSERWSRERLNPIEMMAKMGGVPDNIIYDPALKKGDYSINRQQSTDGTLAITYMQLAEMFNLLVKRESFCKSNPPDWRRLKDIRYTVGPLKLVTVRGRVDLPCGRFPGQKERFRLPVKVEYIYKGDDLDK